MKRVGFVGLGNMGGPMASHLVAPSAQLQVFDIDPAAVARLVDRGAVAAPDVASLAQTCEIVFTSLPGPVEVDEISIGIFENLKAGSIWVDTTTNAPDRARALADLAGDADVYFLDAPVTGGIEGAHAASLRVMVGGSPQALATVRPMLDQIGSDVVHVGSAGAGCAMKLVVNLLGLSHTALAAEALSLGVASGLNVDVMLETLEGSWGDNAMLRDTAATASDEHWGFTRALARKDLTLALNISARSMTPIAETVRRLLAAQPDADLWTLVQEYERAAGIRLDDSG